MKFASLCLALLMLVPACPMDEEDDDGGGGFLSLSAPSELPLGSTALVTATYRMYPDDRHPSPPNISSWSATGVVQIVSHTTYGAMIQGTGVGTGTISASNGSASSGRTVTITASGALLIEEEE